LIASRASWYTWTKFDSDIIQMLGSEIPELVEEDGLEKNEIRRLRVELTIDGKEDDYADEFFFHNHSHRIRDLPKLEACDVLVNQIYDWAHYSRDMYWGACPKSHVRYIDVSTGEWVSEDTAGPYIDWIDTNRGESRDYQRIIDEWDEEDEEDVKQREEALMKMKEPLPRIDLDY
jgi:hypothetical protein